jgi:hypothetical protein
MTRHAVELSLERLGGPSVVLAEITPSQMFLASKKAGSAGSGIAAGLRVARAALLWSVQRIGGLEVGFTDLDAGGLERMLPASRWILAAETAWTRMHTPSGGEIEKLEAGMAVTAGPGGEVWTCTLPAHDDTPVRVVTMTDVGVASIEEIIQEASDSSKAPAAQAFRAILSGCQRSIRAIGGAPVTTEDLKGAKWDALFSVKETHLLGRAYDRIHGTGGDLGEATPVSI